VSFIPQDSTIYKLIADIRGWHAGESDWRKTRDKIAGRYGYDKFGGGCHMVPNHALIIHALLHGDDDFQKSLMIVNTCGWDTDCNSGNVGCLLGIKNGLVGIEAGPDYRTPVADRMYLPTADGGRAITDALTETYHVVNAGRRLAGLDAIAPKNGARFHFELPGAVQGFQPEDSIEVRGTVAVENVAGHSTQGERSLAIRYTGVASPRAARVATPTFIPSEDIAQYFEKRGYRLICSPALYSGQTVEAGVQADAGNGQVVRANLYVRVFGAEDKLSIVRGTPVEVAPGSAAVLRWQVPDTGGSPIAEIGVEITSDGRADGTLYLDTLGWDGTPNTTFRRPDHPGRMWRRAWVNGLDHDDRIELVEWYPDAYRVIQNEGRGLMIQGTREWRDYRTSATITPHMFKAGGIAARVQGMKRYYALLLDGEGQVRLVKVRDGEKTLAEAPAAWRFGDAVALGLKVEGDRLIGTVNGQVVIDTRDTDAPLLEGAVALVCEEGRYGCNSLSVQPL
jgi:hypothetical protein